MKNLRSNYWLFERGCILILSLLLFGQIHAKPPTYVETPYLWRLETKPVSWLFGTIHLPDSRLMNFHPAVEIAFNQAEVVFVEVPLDAKGTMEAMLSSMRTDGKTLSEVLSPITKRRLEDKLEKISPQLSIKVFDRMKTWAVYMALLLLPSELENPGATALDAYMYQLAEMEGKKVGALETVAEQIASIEVMTEEEQIEILEETLNALDALDAKGLDYTEKILNDYLKGQLDMDKLMQLTPMKNKALEAKFYASLLDRRNIRMAKRIKEQLDNNPTKSHFFAVGAAHLLGENDIQHILEKSGLLSTPIGVESNQ